MNNLVKALNDKHVSLVLTVALIAYIAYFYLPAVATFLGTWYGKALMCVVIVMVAHHNITIALLLTLAFLKKSIEILHKEFKLK